MFCTNCGVELTNDARFCVECGTQTEVEAVPVAAPASVRRGRRTPVVIGAVALAVVAAGGAYWYTNRLAKLKVDEVVAELDGKVGVTYADVSANPFTRAVSLKDVTITSLAGKPIDGVRVQVLTIKGNPAKDADPHELDVRVDNLSLDLARMGPVWAKWVTMGYGTVVVDSHLDYQYSRKAGEFDLNRFEIAAQDLLSVSLSLHLGDIGADVASPKEALSQPTMTIRGGELEIKDAVLIDRLINSMAEKDGVTAAAYKERLTDTVSAVLAGGGRKLESDLSTAVVRLINEPRGTLRVTIAPEAPVSLQALKKAGDPGRQVMMLNLKVGN